MPLDCHPHRPLTSQQTPSPTETAPVRAALCLNLPVGFLSPSPTPLPDEVLSSQDFHSPGGHAHQQGRTELLPGFPLSGMQGWGSSGTTEPRGAGEILTGCLGSLHRKRSTPRTQDSQEQPKTETPPTNEMTLAIHSPQTSHRDPPCEP